VRAADDPDAAGQPGYLLKRAQMALHQAMARALDPHGLTVAQYAVLSALAEEPGLSNADLARRAFVTPQSMNKFLRDLEKQQLVVRQPHPGHGRVLQATLTPEGRRVAAAAAAAVDTLERRMLAGLSPQDQDQLAKALSSCIGALTQLPGKRPGGPSRSVTNPPCA
jgi:DNA-binding MarR family transcriptional regulator